MLAEGWLQTSHWRRISGGEAWRRGSEWRGRMLGGSGSTRKREHRTMGCRSFKTFETGRDAAHVRLKVVGRKVKDCRTAMSVCPTNNSRWVTKVNIGWHRSFAASKESKYAHTRRGRRVERAGSIDGGKEDLLHHLIFASITSRRGNVQMANMSVEGGWVFGTGLNRTRQSGECASGKLPLRLVFKRLLVVAPSPLIDSVRNQKKAGNGF
ncbi:hypothetical protein B0H16DRAFT_1683367 [Mycena metata]|uniref:Uncharacterized protein n=1 Tax=Mycena metata TaxID=1033252 RepID=A0AAD7K8B3_9AGAR|nr:hypothetical protein B0H16DRAFT_1683367 [Mycena metata]